MMKTILKMLSILLLAVFLLIAAGCASSENGATPDNKTSSAGQNTPAPALIELTAAEGEPANGFKWENNYSEITITGYIGASNNLRVPDKINGKPVTVIANNSFKGFEAMTSIYVPSSVTTIGEGAFSGCTGLTSVTIPDSVTSIRYQTFYYCMSLTSVTIGNSVTSIGEEAFYGCRGLRTVYYSGSLAQWCGINFSRNSSNPCSNGAALYIQGDLLTNAVIPDSVTSIGGYAFYGYTGLTSVTIPNSVTRIGGLAFAYCTGLTSVTIPDSVTTIDYAAFEFCTGLTSVTIPDSVTTIYPWAFSGCTGLTNINVSFGNAKYHSAGNCIIETATKTLIAGCKNSVIPTDGSVTSIGRYAFSNCTGLTSVTIPDSVTSIGSEAFYGCRGLTSVMIGNSVTEIGDSTFYGCTKLTTVYYRGSSSQWSQISIGSSNDPLNNATKVYNYTGA